MTDAERIALLVERLADACAAHRYHDDESAFPPTCGVCGAPWPCDNETCPVGGGHAALRFIGRGDVVDRRLAVTLPPRCGACAGHWPCDDPACPVGAWFLARATPPHPGP